MTTAAGFSATAFSRIVIWPLMSDSDWAPSSGTLTPRSLAACAGAGEHDLPVGRRRVLDDDRDRRLVRGVARRAEDGGERRQSGRNQEFLHVFPPIFREPGWLSSAFEFRGPDRASWDDRSSARVETASIARGECFRDAAIGRNSWTPSGATWSSRASANAPALMNGFPAMSWEMTADGTNKRSNSAIPRRTSVRRQARERCRLC